MTVMGQNSSPKSAGENTGKGTGGQRRPNFRVCISTSPSFTVGCGRPASPAMVSRPGRGGCNRLDKAVNTSGVQLDSLMQSYTYIDRGWMGAAPSPGKSHPPSHVGSPRPDPHTRRMGPGASARRAGRANVRREEKTFINQGGVGGGVPPGTRGAMHLSPPPPRFSSVSRIFGFIRSHRYEGGLP